MWKHIYVHCSCYPGSVRKLAIFVHENKVYDVNICDFGSCADSCKKCIVEYYSLLKEHPELLTEINSPDNPLHLKSD